MVFAGLASVVAKFGMENMSSDSVLAIRTAVVFAFVLVNAFLFKMPSTKSKTHPPGTWV